MKILLVVTTLLFSLQLKAGSYEGFIRKKATGFYLDQKNSGGTKSVLLGNSNILDLNKYRDIYVTFSGKTVKCKTKLQVNSQCILIEADLSPKVYNPIYTK